jgi:hypothetical protein
MIEPGNLARKKWCYEVKEHSQIRRQSFEANECSIRQDCKAQCLNLGLNVPSGSSPALDGEKSVTTHLGTETNLVIV